MFRLACDRALTSSLPDESKVDIRIAVAIDDIYEKLSEKVENIDSISYTHKLAFLENLEIIKRSI